MSAESVYEGCELMRLRDLASEAGVTLNVLVLPDGTTEVRLFSPGEAFAAPIEGVSTAAVVSEAIRVLQEVK